MRRSLPALFTSLATFFAGCLSAANTKPMQPGFEKARSSFRDYAAQESKRRPEQISLRPASEAEADTMQAVVGPAQFAAKVGRAWAFEASGAGGAGDLPLRGWALPDGTVVTTRQNLGRLFEEAGTWTAAPALGATELAVRIIWAMGPNYWGVSAPPERPLPAMTAAADGKRELVFFAGMRAPGAGGAGGGPSAVYQCTVKLSADHQAQLALSKDLNP